MNMKITIKKALPISIFLFLHIGLANAWGWGKYDTYECPSIDSAISCNSVCRKSNFQNEFKLNNEKNIVLLIQYENGVSIGSKVLENCTIFDAKNWSCKSGVNGFTEHKYDMENGIYIQTLIYLKGNLKDSFSCAKR
jgi:hypothetical protein